MKFCPECGHQLRAPDATICATCGAGMDRYRPGSGGVALSDGPTSPPAHAEDAQPTSASDHRWRDQANVATALHPCGAKAVAAGYSHCVAIAADNTVVVWGDNDYGQLNVPNGLSDVVAIAAGAYHSLALLSNGTVVAWGQWSYGCTDVPVGLHDVTSVAAGRDFSLALRSDGTVVEWGHAFPAEAHVPDSLSDIVAIATDVGNRLALGRDGSVTIWGALMRGQAPSEPLLDVRSIDVGWEHAVALRDDGTILTWRNGEDGIDAPQGLRDVVSVATFGSDSLAVKSDGTVVAWGNDYSSNLRVPSNLRDGVSVAISNGCAMALKKDGSISVWGQAGDGQHNVPERLLVPQARDDQGVAQAMHVVAVATGLEHSLGLRADGTVVAWGGNSHGQTDVPAGLNGVVAIAACWLQSIALRGDGTVATWGYSERRAEVPRGLSGVVSIAAGRSHYLAVRRDGTVVAWGYPDERVNVPAGLSEVIAVAAGHDQNIALRRDGTVVAWGNSRYGGLKLSSTATDLIAIACGLHPGMSQHFLGVTRLGDVTKLAGTTFAEEGDVPVELHGATAVAGGGAHSIALMNDGRVVAWGTGAQGQLDVPAWLTDVIGIAAHTTHNLALRSDGTIVSWGTNNSGALAVPAELRASSPELGHGELNAVRNDERVTPGPIVEALGGRVSFLRGSGRVGDPFLMDGRTEPFPDIDSLERIRSVHRAMARDSDAEHYAYGRAASNLAAAYTAAGRLVVALETIQEAENWFVEMLNSGNPHPEDLTFMGLAIARYNASYMLVAAGDIGRNLEYAETNGLAAREALSEVSVRRSSWGFVDRALIALKEI